MRKRLRAVKKLAVSPGGCRDGITLVEVIVSMALLGIVVVLISTMLMTGFTITCMNQPKTSNIYKVGGRVAAGGASAGSSTVADGVIISGDAGSVTFLSAVLLRMYRAPIKTAQQSPARLRSMRRVHGLSIPTAEIR